MKRLTMQILFAAAALSAVAVSAPAQTVTAEVPFGFHAGAYALAPGAYEVKLMPGTNAVALRSPDTGKSVIVVTSHSPSIPAAWKQSGHARLRFDCAGVRCILRDVWPGLDSRAAALAGPRFAREEAVVSREIRLTRASTK